MNGMNRDTDRIDRKERKERTERKERKERTERTDSHIVVDYYSIYYYDSC